MPRLFLNVLLIIAACAPLVLLAIDIAQRYPANEPLTNIGPLEAIMLIAALGLPLFVLTRLGINWRTGPEEY